MAKNKMPGYMREIEKGKWELTISLGSDSTGKRKRKFRTVYAKSEKEAGKKLAEFYVECQKIKPVPNILIKDYARHWFKNYVESKKYNTISNYNFITKRFIKYIGNKKLNEITTKNIKKFYEDLRKNNHLSESTIIANHTAIRCLFNYAYEEELINENPCDRIRLKSDTETKNIFSIEQANKFIKVIDNVNESVKVGIYIAIYTGLRKGEILGLKWSDIDFENKVIHIKRQYGYNYKFKHYFDTPKTKTSEREVGFPDKLLKVLVEYKNYYLRINERYDIKSNYLFITKRGKMFDTDRFGKTMRKVISENGLPDITFHGLRHLYTSLKIEAGENITNIAGDLGHKNILMLSKTYAHSVKKSDPDLLNNILD
ncbi:MAG: tyrosine-type recombinase/integrase [Syntrophothermus sp.]